MSTPAIDIFQHLYWQVPLNKWVSVYDLFSGNFTQNLKLSEILDALRILNSEGIVELKNGMVRIKPEINQRVDLDVETNVLKKLGDDFPVSYLSKLETLKLQTEINKNLAFLRGHFRNDKNKKRIFDRDIELARRYSIDSLLEFNRYGKTLCLWHDDTNPSLHLYRDTNSVYCFSCQHSADVIDVFMKLHNCDFKKAVLSLANHEIKKVFPGSTVLETKKQKTLMEVFQHE